MSNFMYTLIVCIHKMTRYSNEILSDNNKTKVCLFDIDGYVKIIFSTNEYSLTDNSIKDLHDKVYGDNCELLWENNLNKSIKKYLNFSDNDALFITTDDVEKLEIDILKINNTLNSFEENLNEINKSIIIQNFDDDEEKKEEKIKSNILNNKYKSNILNDEYYKKNKTEKKDIVFLS